MFEDDFNARFKFQIGDVLAHKGQVCPRITDDSYLGAVEPERWVVVERFLNQCHGGLQQSYSCRVAGIHERSMGISKKLLTLNESELVPYPSPVKTE